MQPVDRLYRSRRACTWIGTRNILIIASRRGRNKRFLVYKSPRHFVLMPVAFEIAYSLLRALRDRRIVCVFEACRV